MTNFQYDRQSTGATRMRLPLAGPLFIVSILVVSSCRESDLAETMQHNCSDIKAVKCSVLNRVISPAHDFEAVTKVDSYGGGFGTGYESADVYIGRVGTNKEDTLLFSIEDNADDLSAKNFTVRWISPEQLEIRYGHGTVTFQVIKFAGKAINATHDAKLDQVARQ